MSWSNISQRLEAAGVNIKVSLWGLGVRVVGLQVEMDETSARPPGSFDRIVP